VVLGLDISTSVIGLSIIDPVTEELKVLEFVNLKKEKDLLQKAIAFKLHLLKYTALTISHICIEEPLVMFKDGFSMAQILAKLSLFNGMCCTMAWMVFGIIPEYYNVNTARKLAFNDIKFPKGANRKSIILNRVHQRYQQIDWMYSKKGALLKFNYDMADAAVIALAKCKELKNASSQTRIESRSETEKV
jgi:hypothetical protein